MCFSVKKVCDKGTSEQTDIVFFDFFFKTWISDFMFVLVSRIVPYVFMI
jgi:hypothetical protein